MPADPARLVDIPLLAGLSENELERVAAWLDTRQAEAGERICGEEAPGYSFFVIESGTATVSQGGEQIATLGPGDFFGEIAILGNGRRTATVTAASPLAYLAMWGGDFRLLEREHPRAAERLARAVTDRVERTAT